MYNKTIINKALKAVPVQTLDIEMTIKKLLRIFYTDNK